MRGRVLLLAVVVMTVAPTPAGPATATGLRGTVLQTRPVCMDDGSCLAPARGVVLVFRRDGRVAARTTSGATGAYRVLLERGTYAVSVANRPRTRLAPTIVRVVGGVVRRVDFALDSGMQ